VEDVERGGDGEEVHPYRGDFLKVLEVLNIEVVTLSTAENNSLVGYY
jgi:hypothetical protein